MIVPRGSPTHENAGGGTRITMRRQPVHSLPSGSARSQTRAHGNHRGCAAMAKKNVFTGGTVAAKIGTLATKQRGPPPLIVCALPVISASFSQTRTRIAPAGTGILRTGPPPCPAHLNGLKSANIPPAWPGNNARNTRARQGSAFTSTALTLASLAETLLPSNSRSVH